MKNAVITIILICALSNIASASDMFYEGLSDLQRYDLADAYWRVAERFNELDETDRSRQLQALAEKIYPGFQKIERPLEEESTPVRSTNETPQFDPNGEKAVTYYFNKLIRGVFTKNISLTLSVMSDTLYLPMFPEGIKKTAITEELEYLFAYYDLSKIGPGDVFDIKSTEVLPLENGYLRLDVTTRPGYENALSELTFWAKKMGFYFRQHPRGWRLAAIGPVG